MATKQSDNKRAKQLQEEYLSSLKGDQEEELKQKYDIILDRKIKRNEIAWCEFTFTFENKQVIKTIGIYTKRQSDYDIEFAINRIIKNNNITKKDKIKELDITKIKNIGEIIK